MSIEPPDFVRVVLTRFENSTGLFREVAIGDALRQGARDKQLSQDERDGCRVESSVFILNPSRGAEPSCWDTYFGPLFSAEREDGTAVDVPDLNEMDEESISYWEG